MPAPDYTLTCQSVKKVLTELAKVGEPNVSPAMLEEHEKTIVGICKELNLREGLDVQAKFNALFHQQGREATAGEWQVVAMYGRIQQIANFLKEKEPQNAEIAELAREAQQAMQALSHAIKLTVNAPVGYGNVVTSESLAREYNYYTPSHLYLILQSVLKSEVANDQVIVRGGVTDKGLADELQKLTSFFPNQFRGQILLPVHFENPQQVVLLRLLPSNSRSGFKIEYYDTAGLPEVAENLPAPYQQSDERAKRFAAVAEHLSGIPLENKSILLDGEPAYLVEIGRRLGTNEELRQLHALAGNPDGRNRYRANLVNSQRRMLQTFMGQEGKIARALSKGLSSAAPHQISNVTARRSQQIEQLGPSTSKSASQAPTRVASVNEQAGAPQRAVTELTRADLEKTLLSPKEKFFYGRLSEEEKGEFIQTALEEEQGKIADETHKLLKKLTEAAEKARIVLSDKMQPEDDLTTKLSNCLALAASRLKRLEQELGEFEVKHGVSIGNPKNTSFTETPVYPTQPAFATKTLEQRGADLLALKEEYQALEQLVAVEEARLGLAGGLTNLKSSEQEINAEEKNITKQWLASKIKHSLTAHKAFETEINNLSAQKAQLLAQTKGLQDQILTISDLEQAKQLARTGAQQALETQYKELIVAQRALNTNLANYSAAENTVDNNASKLAENWLNRKRDARAALGHHQGLEVEDAQKSKVWQTRLKVASLIGLMLLGVVVGFLLASNLPLVVGAVFAGLTPIILTFVFKHQKKQRLIEIKQRHAEEQNNLQESRGKEVAKFLEHQWIEEKDAEGNTVWKKNEEYIKGTKIILQLCNAERKQEDSTLTTREEETVDNESVREAIYILMHVRRGVSESERWGLWGLYDWETKGRFFGIQKNKAGQTIGSEFWDTNASREGRVGHVGENTSFFKEIIPQIFTQHGVKKQERIFAVFLDELLRDPRKVGLTPAQQTDLLLNVLLPLCEQVEPHEKGRAELKNIATRLLEISPAAAAALVERLLQQANNQAAQEWQRDKCSAMAASAIEGVLSNTMEGVFGTEALAKQQEVLIGLSNQIGFQTALQQLFEGAWMSMGMQEDQKSRIREIYSNLVRVLASPAADEKNAKTLENLLVTAIETCDRFWESKTGLNYQHSAEPLLEKSIMQRVENAQYAEAMGVAARRASQEGQNENQSYQLFAWFQSTVVPLLQAGKARPSLAETEWCRGASREQLKELQYSYDQLCQEYDTKLREDQLKTCLPKFQKIYEKRAYGKGSQVAEKAQAQAILALSNPLLNTHSDQQQVADALHQLYGQGNFKTIIKQHLENVKEIATNKLATAKNTESFLLEQIKPLLGNDEELFNMVKSLWSDESQLNSETIASVSGSSISSSSMNMQDIDRLLSQRSRSDSEGHISQLDQIKTALTRVMSDTRLDEAEKRERLLVIYLCYRQKNEGASEQILQVVQENEELQPLQTLMQEITQEVKDASITLESKILPLVAQEYVQQEARRLGRGINKLRANFEKDARTRESRQSQAMLGKMLVAINEAYAEVTGDTEYEELLLPTRQERVVALNTQQIERGLGMAETNITSTSQLSAQIPPAQENIRVGESTPLMEGEPQRSVQSQQPISRNFAANKKQVAETLQLRRPPVPQPPQLNKASSSSSKQRKRAEQQPTSKEKPKINLSSSRYSLYGGERSKGKEREIPDASNLIALENVDTLSSVQPPEAEGKSFPFMQFKDEPDKWEEYQSGSDSEDEDAVQEFGSAARRLNSNARR